MSGPSGSVILAIVLLLLELVSPRVARSEEGAEGEPPPGTERAVLYLSPRPAPGSTDPGPVDWETLRRNLPHYLRVPLAGTHFVQIDAPALQSRFIRFHPKDPLETQCGETYQGDFFRLELGRLGLALEDDAGLEDFQKGLEGLISRFHCQTGGEPLETRSLRQALLWQAISYYLVADARRRDLSLFGQAYALGGREMLGDGLEGRFSENSGLWEVYTQAIRQFQKEFHRLPVTVNVSRLPTRTVFIDGERLTARALAGEPLQLYPGRHFVQEVDTRGRIRSATFAVPFDQAAFQLELGQGAWFPPRADEADELLWRALNTAPFTLPDWLKQSLGDYLNAHRLKALYVVAPDGDRRNEPDGDLLAARFETGQGLIELEKQARGDRFIPLLERTAPLQVQYIAGRWMAGLGVSRLVGQSFGSIDLGLTLVSGGSLRVMSGVSFYQSGLSSSQLRAMADMWAGVLHEPSEPELGWLYGLSLGLISPGVVRVTSAESSAMPVIIPAPRVHLGVEWPLQRYLYDGRGPRLRRLTALRLELMLSSLYGVDAVAPDAGPVEWMFEGRLSLRFWRARSMVE